jgi:hypothetical protein
MSTTENHWNNEGFKSQRKPLYGIALGRIYAPVNVIEVIVNCIIDLKLFQRLRLVFWRTRNVGKPNSNPSSIKMFL